MVEVRMVVVVGSFAVDWDH